MAPAEVWSEEKWQAESDARTLAEATMIKKDQSRLDKATTAADRMAEEKAKEAASLKQVANTRAGSRPVSTQRPSNYFSKGGGIKIKKKA